VIGYSSSIERDGDSVSTLEPFSVVGNAVEQSRKFDEAIGVDGVALTKVDVNKKGGAILSACKILGKPIVGLGVGQGYDDLKEFDREEFIRSLLE
jgi:fused signal recognition particle receptor